MCLKLGIDDPEKWLATKPKRVVNLWAAYWRLEPWGLEWHRHASMMSVLYMLCTNIACMFGGKSDSKAYRFRDWMPSDWQDDSPQTPNSKLTITQQLDIVAKAFGARRK